jgi:hypothetical protein
MRRLLMLVVSASLMAGLAVVAPSVVTPSKAPQAQAGSWDAPYTVDVLPSARGYDISVGLACREQRHPAAFAQPLSWSNPYSWRCYRVINWWTGQLQYLGDVNLNQYCMRHHGTWAKLTEPWKGAGGWTCAGGVA